MFSFVINLKKFKNMKKIKLTLLFVVLLNISMNAQTIVSEYKIANKFHVDGDGGWDYLTIDDNSNLLYVSHGMVVNVLDVTNGKLVGTISDTKGVHGIALANDLNKGFISNGKDSSVLVFDLKTLTIIAKINVTGKNPDAIYYDLFSQKVFVYNGRTSNATVIDATTNKIVATIPLSGKPEFSVSDGKGKVFVNIEDKNKIAVINSTTLKVDNEWSVAPGDEPSGLAIDKENNILFSVCGNKLMVIVDATSGKIITTLPIGDRTDGVAFDTSKKRAYSSNGEGTITVVQEESKDKFKVAENIVTQKGARTITVSQKTHHIYLPTAEFGPAPEPTKENPRSRPSIKPNSFVILDVVPLK